MKDWKTTLAGVATILGTLCSAGLALYHGQPLNFPVVTAGITAGIGLIHAADSKPAA
jgi:uncharacterized membrane protein YjjP (DUF1212 family)